MQDISFDFNTMTGGQNPFDEKQKSVDTRFFVLPKDQNGNGVAVIRFLPDGDIRENGQMGTIQRIFKINYTNTKTKRFINELSPQTIGEKCPFFDEWQRHWNAGNKEEAKKFGRTTRYFTNIKVLKCPADPSLEGKIFLFDMSYTMAEKIKGLISPSEEEIAIGKKPMNLFNPLKGNNFILKSKKAPTGFISYDDSQPDPNETAIYSSKEEAIEEIKTKCYKLEEFLQPEAYKSYNELRSLIDEVIYNRTSEPKTAKVEEVDTLLTDTSSSVETVVEEVKQEVPQTPNAQTDDLDALIADLTK